MGLTDMYQRSTQPLCLEPALALHLAKLWVHLSVSAFADDLHELTNTVRKKFKGFACSTRELADVPSFCAALAARNAMVHLKICNAIEHES